MPQGIPAGVTAIMSAVLPAVIGGVAKSAAGNSQLDKQHKWETENQLDPLSKDKDFGAALAAELERRKNVAGPTLSRDGRPIMFSKKY